MIKEFDNYIFDLYGTLVDIHTDEQKDSLWLIVSRFFRTYGAQYGVSELRGRYFELVKHEQALAVKKYGGEPEIDLAIVFRTLFEDRGVKTGDTELAVFANMFRLLSIEKLKLFDGAAELLKRLRAAGKGVYLLTNAQSLFTIPELTLLNLRDSFDDILISSEIGFKKPDPRFFNALIERHSLDVSRCVMVGNDDYSDCEGAANVGMSSFYVCTEQSPKREKPLPNGCVEVKSVGDVFPPRAGTRVLSFAL